MEVRLSAADLGSRVVIRWRRPAGDRDEIADVVGVLTAADTASFTVRKTSGELVTIPRDRALAGKTVPAAPRRERGAGTRRRGDAPGRSDLPGTRYVELSRNLLIHRPASGCRRPISGRGLNQAARSGRGGLPAKARRDAAAG